MLCVHAHYYEHYCSWCSMSAHDAAARQETREVLLVHSQEEGCEGQKLPPASQMNERGALFRSGMRTLVFMICCKDSRMYGLSVKGLLIYAPCRLSFFRCLLFRLLRARACSDRALNFFFDAFKSLPHLLSTKLVVRVALLRVGNCFKRSSVFGRAIYSCVI